MSRATIKTAVKSALVTAATAAGSNVEIERTDPWPEGDLPAINIRVQGEEIEYTTSVPARTRLHTMQLVIEATGRETAANTCDEVLDALLDEIDAGLTDHTLGGVCRDLMLGDLEVEINTAGQRVMGTYRQNLSVIYTSTEP